ncbi:hypothetical protein [Bythopirellula polymerisocia]|uniref:Uncharacterized protein n=1 Tax=Bythopirellula polymerisocia TaxID=2528003 RepID=A0A5C6CY21_9BACT|nr:hypothetical protein [Bythopirellula polymerisocia]TWU29512.1 hypothetical protein Pla144_02900 [Bythopirellula polymerisocia]
MPQPVFPYISKEQRNIVKRHVVVPPNLVIQILSENPRYDRSINSTSGHNSASQNTGRLTPSDSTSVFSSTAMAALGFSRDMTIAINPRNLPNTRLVLSPSVDE